MYSYWALTFQNQSWRNVIINTQTFKRLEKIEMNFFADNIPALNIYDKSTNYMLYKSKNHVTTAQKCNDNS